MKKRNIFLYLFLVIFLLVTSYLIFQSKLVDNLPSVTKVHEKVVVSEYDTQLSIGENVIGVEIADDEEEARIGLSGRDDLCEDCGLYFNLGYRDTIPTFWMKDMLIPIDIIWIDNGVVVDITKNISIPEPDTPDYQLERYRPSQKIDNVLEINAGYSDKLNIEIGDEVVLITD